MVSMEEAEKIAIEFIKKKTNPIKPVAIVSARPKEGNAWTVGGNYVVKISGMQNWVFDFSLDIDENGNVTSYNLSV